MQILKNGTVWKDTDNNPIHAHGGDILFSGGWYYWYGEDRRENYYVNCYRSQDLINWEFRGHVLTTESPQDPLSYDYDLTIRRDPLRDYGERSILCIDGKDIWHKVNIERPKVIYNAKTGKYVMWMHFENGVNYDYARAAVATCDTPDGDFVFHGSFRPLGHMSRDCTLFQDDDGTAYFISSSNENADTHVYRLSDDFLSAESLAARLFVGEFREAPVLFKYKERYYIFNSCCTGWDPNQCKYSSATAIDSEWEPLQDCADHTTWNTQPAFLLQINGTEGELFLYMGDRWSGSEYFSSSYVLLPLEFTGEKGMDFSYVDYFSIDVQAGRYIKCKCL